MFNKKKKILITNLIGTIQQGKNSISNSADNLLNLFHEQMISREYCAILININSPGGSAGFSLELAKTIQHFKRSYEIPVYAHIVDLACSGAYLVAVHCDKIFANEMSIVGSIGTIMQIPNFSKTADKIGFDMTTIKSGNLKDIGNPFREMTEKEKKYLQTLVDDNHETFKTIVRNQRYAKGKEITKDVLNEGRIYSANDALELGLIDHIGTSAEALIMLINSLNNGKMKDYKIVNKTTPSLLSRILNIVSNVNVSLNVPEFTMK